jgi:DNA-binding NtrC family response regulator
MKGLGSSANSGKDQRIRVLTMDPAEKDQQTMARFLAAWNFDPVAVSNPEEAIDLVKEEAISIAVISHSEGGREDLELVRDLRRAHPGLETILLAADDSPKFTTEAFRAGVYDCLKPPIDFKQLSRDLNTLREAVQRRIERKAWDATAETVVALEGIVGISAPMQAVFASIRRFAREDSPVLITGLIGSGKELVARAVHALSGRAGGPLVVYRCCGVTEALAAMELFGQPPRSSHLRGQNHSSSGMEQSVLESACGGTLLLDEIADLPAFIQARLAEVLCKGEGCDAGGRPFQASKTRSFRLLAISRLNLADQAARGQFNPELYQFLSHSVLHLSSLVERQEDIPLLCRHFQERFNREFGKATQAFSPAAERALSSYPWPGNVRELENVIGRACLLADQDWIELSDLSIAAPLSAGAWPARNWQSTSKDLRSSEAMEARPTGKNSRKSEPVKAKLPAPK